MSLIVDIRRDLGPFRLDVQFETEEGITGLLGPSGCGKSFTLKCIAGIEKPDSGHIELDGTVLYDSKEHIDLPPQKRRVGYLFQNYALFPNMTVRQNILCGIHREKDRAERERKLKDILEMMQLKELSGHKPAQLSGGQQQRTALARILVSDPQMLMLDEPFSALDSHLRDSLKVELKSMMKRYGRNVLMVTHSRDEAYNMSEKIAVMDSGRVIAMKPTKELFSDPGSIQAAVLTGCKNISAAVKRSGHEVYVPEWGITLKTEKEVKDGLRAVGLRAHYFSDSVTENRYPVTFTDEMEEPFEKVLRFRFFSQDPASPPVWWRITKDKVPRPGASELGIAPADVLLLYDAGQKDKGAEELPYKR